MINLEKYETKHPFIVKKIKNMPDLDLTYIKQIEHFFSIFNRYQYTIKEYNLNYAQFTTFKSLYLILLQISGERFIQRPPDYSSFKEIDGWYIIESKSLETTQIYGSHTWCITHNQKWWDIYNHKKRHYILVNKKNPIQKYGVSTARFFVRIFDENDHPVDLKDLIIKLPNLTAHIKLDKPDGFRNLREEYWNIGFCAFNLFCASNAISDSTNPAYLYHIHSILVTFFLVLIWFHFKSNIVAYNYTKMHRHVLFTIVSCIITLVLYSNNFILAFSNEPNQAERTILAFSGINIISSIMLIGFVSMKYIKIISSKLKQKFIAL